VGIWDAFPVSPGHVLLIPRRHVPDWFEATDDERRELLTATAIAKAEIEARHRPEGYNIGINVGQAAGQTVFHLHLHVIPRYPGDVEDPRGGVRHVLPARANYLASTEPAATPDLVADADQALAYASRRAPEVDRRSLIAGWDDPLLPHLRRALDGAKQADIAVAFVLQRGIDLVADHLADLLERGGRLRFLTGDYLDCTEPTALRTLLDLAAFAPDRAQVRIFDAADLSFHPKAYITYSSDDRCIAFVGSSNLTQIALRHGVEWNYRIVAADDTPEFGEIARGFERLFSHPRSVPLTSAWIDAYSRRRQQSVLRSRHQPVEVPEEAPEPPPEPHAIQRDALAALERTRAEGNAAGLVVLGTGLGKTFLAAFDSKRPEFRRILFVAHREEILRQALGTFRRIRPWASFGRFAAGEKAADADILFASIQTLGKMRHLRDFAPATFDYIVVDEFHHAAAGTYRRLIAHFTPKFLLGLTATPERTDGGDLLSLCQENLVYRCDFPAGIERGLLSPFKYLGVPDTVDYRNIPWRNARFDETALTAAVATGARAQNALEQYRKHAGQRTIAYCCSVRHADYMRRYFAAQGVRCAAVHSQTSSDPRTGSLERLAAREIDVLFAVDMLNEGIDLPSIDTVLMLRPTESRIIWLQQFGRGLRRSDGKSHLTVIDYIGNHRSFLLKAQALFGLPEGDAHIERTLNLLAERAYELPPGCEATYELEAMDILRGLLRRASDREALKLYYEEFRERTGARPTAVEAFHDGYKPGACRNTHGSWLGFVRAMEDLQEFPDSAELGTAKRFLKSLETTAMAKSYKMLVLQTMLDAERFPGELPIAELVERFGRLARTSATLAADVGAPLENAEELRRHVETNPIAAWTGGKGTGGESFFVYRSGMFGTTFDLPQEYCATFRGLVQELVEWRLAQYLSRPRVSGSAGAHFECPVSHAGGRPILFLDRKRAEGIPQGWTRIVVDDEALEANFVKVALNVVRQPGSDDNLLPEILRRWFGEAAGAPGTRHRVRFDPSDDGWVMTQMMNV
jgi:superfamily II DNA or RNA helicase/HKD family nuclease/diadenosine tetraphosphate (Ap4A) HIT family hydrolase